MLKKGFCLSLILFVSISVFGNTKWLSTEEEKILNSNLNYIQYSICKIKETDNKAIAEDEYYSVINELNINIINNQELQDEYESFLNHCKDLKLNQNEKDFLREMNSRELQNAWKSAFSSMGSVFVPGANFVQTAISLVYTATANYLNVQNTKIQLNTQLEKDLFYLNQEALSSIYMMQTELFSTSMKLLAGKVSDDRIIEDTMRIFVHILNNSNSLEKIAALTEKSFQKNMDFFPPYWYELGNAYQISGNNNEALKAYRKFEELKKNDVLKRDSTYVKLLKNKIQILLEKDKLKNRKEILRCIDLINQNSLDTKAGEKNSYLSKVYFMIGENQQALKCIDYILNTKSINSEYLNDAVNLKLLILASESGRSSNLYQNVYKYSSINFGGKSKLFNDTFSDYLEKNFFVKSKDLVVNKVAGIFSKDDANKIEINKSFINDKYLYFSLPTSLFSEENMYFTINEEIYIPNFVCSNNLETLYYIDFSTKDIDQVLNLTINFTSNTTGEKNSVSYSFTKIDNKVFDSASKAFERMGTNINVYNSELANLFGKTLRETKFKYTVKDIEDLRKEITKDENKKNEDRAVPFTALQVQNEINSTLAQKLQIDVINLQKLFNNVSKEYFNKTEALFEPECITIYGDVYSVGISSIFSPSVEKNISFDSIGNCVIREKTESINIPFTLNELYEKAIAGDIISSIELGIAYYDGNGTETNYNEAIKWLFKGINIEKDGDLTSTELLKLSIAYKYISDSYLNGNGVKKNKELANYWLEKAYNINR